MSNIYDFEKLATLAIKRELKNHTSLIRHFDAGITVFRTEHMPEPRKRTVTVWFEVKTNYPKFWDIMPVIIVYEGHDLYLADISKRASDYFKDTVKRLQKRFLRLMIPLLPSP